MGLPLPKQHKKCAELVWRLYHNMAEQELEQYNQLLMWMNEEPLISMSSQDLANRYHWHLKKGNISKREHHLLPAIRKGDRTEAMNPWPIAIYLDHIRSAHNVGSILRTVEALRLGSIHFSENTPFKDHKQVQDTSMGAYAWVSCYQGYALSELPKPVIALETSEEAISIYEFIFPEAFTLVLGNEEYGCSEASLREADYIVEIPLRGHKNSLNVANAFAMVAGEIYRQKNFQRNTNVERKAK